MEINLGKVTFDISFDTKYELVPNYDGYLKFYDRYPIKEHFQNSEEGYWEISIFREQIEKIAERVLVAE